MRIRGLLLCVALLGGCSSTSAPKSSPPSSAVRPPAVSSTRLDLPHTPGSSGRRSRRARPSDNSQPGAFDFYLLALSWSPQFCATHPGSQECAAHPGFVVHGLWPQDNDGTYPENCSTAAGPANPQQYTDLIPTVSLIKHEWAAHGTCSGLAPDAFFEEVGKAFHQIKIPAAFVNPGQAASLTPGSIIDQFMAANLGLPQGSIALTCGNNSLTAVEICFSKTLTPEACQNVHTCGATVVSVTPR